MCVASKDSKNATLLRSGMMLMAMAEITRFVVQRQQITSGLADGFTGLLFGLAIGTMLLGVYLGAHRRDGGRS